MFFRIKQENLNELKNGRTNKYIANRIGCTEQHICNVFKSKTNCSKALALSLVSLDTNQSDLESKINYYFDKVD